TSEAEYRGFPAPSFEGKPAIPSKAATEKTQKPSADDPPSDPYYPTSDVDRFTLENFLELEEWHRQKLDDDRHPPECINRHPCLDELLGYTVEIEPIEERMHKSATSHFSVPKHQRLCEAVGIHKRVNQIHDPVKFVVPCFVFEAESPIPPERKRYKMVKTSEAEYRGFPAPSFEGEPAIPSKAATEKTQKPSADDPPSDPYSFFLNP
ncbi:hypothetical protein HID58_013570, partial [Brassica napus]